MRFVAGLTYTFRIDVINARNGPVLESRSIAADATAGP
jgi:hypothetical protein